jgi:hypothetical protein
MLDISALKKELDEADQGCKKHFPFSPYKY